MSCCGDVLRCSIDLAIISRIIGWHSILQEMLTVQKLCNQITHDDITHIMQLEVNVVETSELVLWWWIAVRSKWNDARASSIFVIVDNAFRAGHIGILKTIGKDYNISTRLQISHPFISENRTETSEYHTLIGTSMVSQVRRARVN